MEFTPHTDRSQERKVDRTRTSLVINHVRNFGITNAKIAEMIGVRESRISEGARPSDGDKKGWQLTEAECNYLTAEFGEPLREPGELIEAQVVSMTGNSAYELTAAILGWNFRDRQVIVPALLGEWEYKTETTKILEASFREPHSFEQWYHGEELMKWLTTYLPLDKAPADLPDDHAEAAKRSFLETLQLQGYSKQFRGGNYDYGLWNEIHLLMVLAALRVLVNAHKPASDTALTFLNDVDKIHCVEKTELVMAADCIWSNEKLYCERLNPVSLLDEVLGCVERDSCHLACDDQVGGHSVSDFWNDLANHGSRACQDCSLRLFLSKTNHYHLLLEKVNGPKCTLLLSDIKPAAFFGLIEFLSGGKFGLPASQLWDIRKHIAASGGYLPGVTVVN
ncbi:hypothetical protein [Ferrimonas kyonanensis]|uniref:hypothetical protein n=1 Tax=Ferrimonas kyonanensis TaxID=364763 RepID=UPI0003F829EF|nr:hypothetical protein [Ferrimonas kyonanensis]